MNELPRRVTASVTTTDAAQALTKFPLYASLKKAISARQDLPGNYDVRVGFNTS